MPIARIAPQVLAFIYPSRYCQLDRLQRFAGREFGHLRPGYRRVQAIGDWVRQRIAFMPGTSNITTSAMETLIEQVGVCRDFAHLMIALCRALNIPARFVTGIDYGAAVELGLPDFHAYVEVFRGDRPGHLDCGARRSRQWLPVATSLSGRPLHEQRDARDRVL
jgi:transglutaminase-like putative cysteine protease